MRGRLVLVVVAVLASACTNDSHHIDHASATDNQDSEPPLEVEVVGSAITPRPIPPDCRYADLPNALRAARARWEGYGVRSYSLTVKHSAMFHYVGWPSQTPLRLQVKNGTATTDISGVDRAILQSITVNGLFDMIDSVAAETPDCLKVSFDPTWGFPASIFVDGDVNVSDDEYMYEVSDLGA